MTEKNAKPQLRFAGFDDTWEQRKLGEVLISLQNNTLSRADLSSEEGIAKNIHYGDILVKFGEVIDLKTESLPMIADETVIAKYKSSFLQNGDVIVADTAEDETVGKCTEIAGLSDEIVISGLHTIPYRPLQKYAPGYLGYYMNSASFHNQLLPLMQGIKVTSISKTALQNTDILYPKSATEQAAIGKYFRNLDNLITLHQRKYDKLTNVKKSMLEKMFPKNGSNVPEIRFKGFSDAWEQRKLGELSEKTFGGGTPNTSNNEYWNGDIPWFQSSDISDGKLFDIAPKKFISQDGLSKSAAQLIPENSIAIITRVGVGKLAFVPFSYTTSQDFLSLSRLKTEPFFTVYACYKKLQSELNAVQGTSIKGITKDELLAKQIMIPNYAEQRQIGAYFKSLDHLITLHQRELEKLKNLKKACLEKMFV